MLMIREITIGSPPRLKIHGYAETLEEALKIVPGDVFCIEEDKDNPGNWDCAASIGSELNVYAIEPVPTP